MCLGIGICRRNCVRLRIGGGRLALDALVRSPAATTAAGAASKATAGAFSAATYASGDAGDDGEENQTGDDDCNNDGPFAVGFGHAVVP